MADRIADITDSLDKHLSSDLHTPGIPSEAAYSHQDGQDSISESTTTTTINTPDKPAMAPSQALFLASLGNPAPYSNTLHSAGHILLDAIATHLNLAPFRSQSGIRPGLSTSDSERTITLWQSPVQMNVSGKPLVQAWKSYLAQLPAGASQAAELYVLHDELEAPLGKIKVRHTGSAKGHNGLKSVISAFGGRADAFRRVGVGIGRPASREPAEVSRYVLRKCREEEIDAIRGAAGEVVRVLEMG